MAKLSVKLFDDGKSYVVKEGLSEGDTIVSEGVGLIHDGETVRAH